MEKSRFRLSICLKHFFTDERSQCYVSVEGHQPVRWLRQRIQKLFGLPLGEYTGFALICRGHLVPEDEPLSLLDHDDTLVVVPVLFEVHPGINNCVDDTLTNSLTTTPKPNAPKMLANGIVNTNDRWDRKSRIIPSPVEVNSVRPSETQQKSPNIVLKTTENSVDHQADNKDRCDELQCLKQKALDLLDQFDSQQESEAQDCPKRKRFRVRRRRRPQDNYHNLDFSLSETIEEKKHSAPWGSLIADAIARNDCLEVRAARLIQPIINNT